MSASKSDLEGALIDGATEGMTSAQLFDQIRQLYPKTKTEKIVRAAFHALSEPTLKDRNVLDVIYALALKHRLDEPSSDDPDTDTSTLKTLIKKAKSKAAILPLPETAKKRRKKEK